MWTHLVFCWQIFLLAAFAAASDWLVNFIGIPIPGNVMGIIILFALLCCGVVKEQWLDRGAAFLLKHLVFFFVPVAVGLMNWGEVFCDYGWTLFFAIVVSAILPVCLTPWIASLLQKKGAE